MSLKFLSPFNVDVWHRCLPLRRVGVIYPRVSDCVARRELSIYQMVSWNTIIRLDTIEPKAWYSMCMSLWVWGVTCNRGVCIVSCWKDDRMWALYGVLSLTYNILSPFRPVPEVLSVGDISDSSLSLPFDGDLEENVKYYIHSLHTYYIWCCL